MREREPSLPEVDAGEMAKLQTLGEIVDYMGAGSASAAAVPAAVSAVSTKPAAGRYALRTVAVEAAGFALPGILTASKLAVIDDGSGVAKALVKELSAHGASAVVVTEVPADADGLIDLTGIRKAKSVDAQYALNRAAFINASAIAGKAKVYVTVQDTGGDFGLSGSDRAWAGGFAGLAKTAAQEWNDAAVRAIDIATKGRKDKAVAIAIANELLAGGTEIEVGLQADGTRLTLESYADISADAAAILGKDDVVVASGGARGVTAATLIALADATKCKLVLLGRTALEDEPAAVKGVDSDAAMKGALLKDAKSRGEKLKPADLGKQVKRIMANREVRATIDAIKATGGDARYVSADVRDRKALNKALKGVRKDWGGITALVHGAGVLADKLIAEKTTDQFDFVFDVKVDGLRSLLEVTKSDDLKALVLFSSVAGRCGNQGQCDYAMANEVLNKVAGLERSKRGEGFVVKSLGWGPWEGGMVTPALKAHFESMGVPLIPLDVGAKMLVDELVSGKLDQVELVLGGKPVSKALAAVGNAPEVAYDILVQHATHPYLSSHQVKGVPVVPVALALEWMARAAKACRPDLVFTTARDIRVLSGITLSHFDNGGDRLHITARQLSNGSGAVLAVDLMGANGRKHYSATVEMSEPGQTVPASSVPSVGNLKKWDDKVYGDVLFHGPDFQVIRELEGVSDSGIAAVMVGAKELGWAGEWQTDTALVDGGLQLALLWTKHATGGASLPTGVGSFHRYVSGLPTGAVRCVLHGETKGKDKVTCHIAFLGGDGQMLAEMRGVDTHVLPGTRKATDRADA